jgi:hypothetical protein
MKYIKAIVFIFIQTTCFGQSTATVSFSLYLADIATIALEPANSTINLGGTFSPTAGSPLTFTSNNTQWINFTSQISVGTRNINAQITSGSLPNGISLKLTISPISGTGAGNPGSTVGSIILSSIKQNIITGIGDAFTATGTGNGYNLKFELVITDFSQLRAGNTSLSITFNIT